MALRQVCLVVLPKVASNGWQHKGWRTHCDSCWRAGSRCAPGQAASMAAAATAARASSWSHRAAGGICSKSWKTRSASFSAFMRGSWSRAALPSVACHNCCHTLPCTPLNVGSLTQLGSRLICNPTREYAASSCETRHWLGGRALSVSSDQACKPNRQPEPTAPTWPVQCNVNLHWPALCNSAYLQASNMAASSSQQHLVISITGEFACRALVCANVSHTDPHKMFAVITSELTATLYISHKQLANKSALWSRRT